MSMSDTAPERPRSAPDAAAAPPDTGTPARDGQGVPTAPLVADARKATDDSLRGWGDTIEMIRARKAWKKAHPGFTSRIHGVVEDSFDAGYMAAMENHVGCHNDLDPCMEQVKEGSRE